MNVGRNTVSLYEIVVVTTANKIHSCKEINSEKAFSTSSNARIDAELR